MLAAIAGSMITVAGVVFSVTLVALSLAASQYSPRVLRTFMGDRPTQVVLGVFVGIFAYCLVVLRTVRGGEENAFVPSIAVLGGIARGAVTAVDGLFPEELGAPAQPGPVPVEVGAGAAGEDEDGGTVAGPWTGVPAAATGYVVSIDSEGLLAFARSSGRVLRMEVGIGEYAICGQAIASLAGSEALGDEDAARLNRCYAVDQQRTIEQDAGFGLQQIVDIALKALSPGINDQTTAIMCIDHLTGILVRLARRRIETPYRRDGGSLRVIAIGPSFASLVTLVYRELRNAADRKRAILARLVWSIERVAADTADAGRRRVLAVQAEAIVPCAQEAIATPHEREVLLARLTRLLAVLRDGGVPGRS
jgi:uncharacterized membrane protein